MSQEKLSESCSSCLSVDKFNLSAKEGDILKVCARSKISTSECDNWKEAVEMLFSSFEFIIEERRLRKRWNLYLAKPNSC